MHPALKIALLIAFLVLYVLGTYFYEVKVMHIAMGWWAEVYKMRLVWSPSVRIGYFAWVSITCFVALPHFLWAPVYLIKELVYLLRQYERSKPYVARHA